MDSPFLGMVQYFAFDWAPKGYTLCNGALLQVSSNTALFALLGTFYGGNGSSTFGVPDLRGRSVVGQSSSYTIGEKFGTTSVTLLTTNMPMHTHSVPSIPIPSFTNPNRGQGGNTDSPAGAVPSTPKAGTMYTATAGTNAYLNANAITVTVGTAGQGLPFNTQNPYLAVTACISTVGLFPSRN
jgi:microcystin-dependent protein